LTARVVVVTGGFGVVGLATGRLASEQGAKVALIDRTEAPTVDCLAIEAVDLADIEAARFAISKVVDRYGHIDALVNIAGGFRWQKLEDGPVETWNLMHRMNVMTAVTASKAALPHIRDGGSIVNVAAATALKAGSGMGAYAASKAGVLRLTESLAEELRDRRVRVNAVVPTVIDTPQNRLDMPDADFSRWSAPAEVAAVILLLTSEAARAVTGAQLTVGATG
jgi:NAD(P)-dependent dehydrogenase (short-subunit alcohol dehydrogenase family)